MNTTTKIRVILKSDSAQFGKACYVWVDSGSKESDSRTIWACESSESDSGCYVFRGEIIF